MGVPVLPFDLSPPNLCFMLIWVILRATKSDRIPLNSETRFRRITNITEQIRILSVAYKET